MKLISDIFKSHIVRELVLILIAGIFIGIIVLKSASMKPKWVTVFILCIVGGSVFLLIPNKEKVLFYVAALLIPIRLNFHPIFIEVEFRRPINGTVIYAIDLVFLLLYFFWIYRIIRNPGIKIRLFPWFSIPYMIILCICMSGWDMVEAHPAIKITTYAIIFKNWLVFIYVANNLNDRKTLYIMAAVLVINGTLQGLLGFLQNLNGGPIGLQLLGETEAVISDAGTVSVTRVTGTIGHANKLALFLEVLIQLNIGFLFSRIDRRFKYFFCATLCMMLTTLGITYSRGAWTATIMGGVINSFWCMTKRTGNIVGSAMIVITVISIFSTSVIMAVPSIRARLFEDDHGTGDIRKPLNLNAKNLIRQNFWRGVGLNNYTFRLHHYDISGDDASWHFSAPVHNEYLLLASELGVPVVGLFFLIFAVIYAVLFSMSISEADPVIPYLSIAFIGAWTGWLFHHLLLYEYFLFARYPCFYFGLIFAMRTMIDRNENQPDKMKANLVSLKKNRV